MKAVEQKQQLKRLGFADRVRHWFSRRCWIRMDPKTAPYGRLVIVRLSNCDYRFGPLYNYHKYGDGSEVAVTHWMDPPGL